jgi:hypothetical protein
MTTDYEALDQSIIDALRRDVEHDAGASAARRRVALRLAASTGVLGLGTSVSATTQAAATAAVATGSAPAVAASSAGLAGATLAGLAKVFAVGLGLGGSVGVGLHVASGAGSSSTPRDAAAGGPSAAVSLARPSPLVQPELPADPAREMPPNASEPNGSPSSNRWPPPERSARPRANPQPELPMPLPPPDDVKTGLAEQQALLDDARAALRRGDAGAALETIRRHVARFPSTAFEEERRAVVIRASLLLGKRSEAHADFERFVAAFPKSLLLPSLRAALSNEGSVTGSHPSSQTLVRE